MAPMNARKCFVALFPSPALAPMAAPAAEVDTQFIFGFTMGADIGELGERELESQTIGRFRKSSGSYGRTKPNSGPKLRLRKNYTSRWASRSPIILSRV
jgi:hypothetical protein